jgi:hypothetical protein
VLSSRICFRGISTQKKRNYKKENKLKREKVKRKVMAISSKTNQYRRIKDQFLLKRQTILKILALEVSRKSLQPRMISLLENILWLRLI